MNNNPAEDQTVFALVNYAPPPLADWLLSLRRSLPVAPSSQPHLTVLPPRPLAIPLREAQEKLTAILSPWRSFEVEVSGVRVFPGSNMLYLEVDDGSSTLRQLHAELNSGEFAHQECFEYHPHVTIGGPVAPECLEAMSAKAVEAWQSSPCPRRFLIEELAFVSISAADRQQDWQRLWTYRLTGNGTYSAAARASISSQTF